MVEAVLNGSSLKVIGGDNVSLDEAFYRVLVDVEVFLDVVFQLLFKTLELAFRIVVVALELHNLLQRLQGLLAFGVVSEPALYHALLEVLVFGVGKLELRCRGDGRVGGYVVEFVVQEHLRGV